ncbi:hypothetical protein [Streptomyces sp. YIM 130001]|uniref:hypothetical protein n=1 Tax=Streptomyces sp. YIM 130001 TaxID=2259644 RepID=UPI000E65437C|nr:hypothetical protein [Streptomyces sp. YIM 130001]
MGDAPQDGFPNDPALRQEWVRQHNLVYAGLIAIGTIMVQPFLSDLSTSVDPAGKVCVLSFAVAIPLLAALVMLSWQETFRRRIVDSRVVGVTRWVAQLSALGGVISGFWHIWWGAGVAVLVSGALALCVFSTGYVRVEWPESAEAD